MLLRLTTCASARVVSKVEKRFRICMNCPFAGLPVALSLKLAGVTATRTVLVGVTVVVSGRHLHADEISAGLEKPLRQAGFGLLFDSRATFCNVAGVGWQIWVDVTVL